MKKIFNLNKLEIAFRKAISGSLIVLMTMLGAPAITLAKANSYTISGNYSINGTTVTLTGISGADPQTGSDGTQHMAVYWDTDQDGNPTSQWEVAPGGMTFTPSFFGSGGNKGFSATWSASFDYSSFGPGSYNVKVMVYHGNTPGEDGDATNTLSFNVEIPVDEFPTANNGSLTTDEDTAANVTLTGTDPENATLTYAINTNPTHGTISLSGSTATYTPSASYNGGDSFKFTVNDGTNTSSPATVSVTVNPVNDAPTIDTTNESWPDGDSIPELVNFSFFVVANDVENDTLEYSLDGDTYGASINSSTGQFSWTPTEEQGPDSYVFNLRVSDGDKDATQTFTINVIEINVAPVLAFIPNQTVDEDSLLTFSIFGSDSDVPVQALTYSVASTDLPSGYTFDPDTMTFSWTPGFGDAGNYQITFAVSDGSPDDDQQSVSIDVGDVNRSPSINEISNMGVDEETNLSFTATATDPDSDTLTFSIEGLPNGAAFDNETGEFSWTPGEDQDGTYEVTISVSDGKGGSSSTQFTITVNEVNVAPTADAKEASTDEDTSVDVTLTGSDTDLPAQTLGYSIATDPSNGNVSISGNVVTYTPDENYNGSDSFTYTVNDGSLTSDEATVTITINPVNDAPTIELNGDDEVTVGEGNEFNDPGAVCSDVDGDETTLTITGELDTNTPGTYELTYTCSDGNQGQASTTRSVTVTSKPVNNKPIIVLNGNASISLTVGNTYSEQGAVANDVEDGNGLVVSDVTGSVNTSVAGTYQVKYNFTDSGSLAADEVIRTVTVNSAPTPPSGGGGGGVVIIPQNNPTPVVQEEGRVLGESACGAYLNSYIKIGRKNDKDDVIRLQQFLNEEMNAGLKVDGLYGPLSFAAVKIFQVKYSGDVLNPWSPFGLRDKTKGTGYVYKTTKHKINMIKCPSLDENFPKLP